MTEDPTKLTSARIEGDLYVRLKQFAKLSRRSINASINVLLAEALDNRDHQKEPQK